MSILDSNFIRTELKEETSKLRLTAQSIVRSFKLGSGENAGMRPQTRLTGTKKRQKGIAHRISKLVDSVSRHTGPEKTSIGKIRQETQLKSTASK